MPSTSAVVSILAAAPTLKKTLVFHLPLGFAEVRRAAGDILPQDDMMTGNKL